MSRAPPVNRENRKRITPMRVAEDDPVAMDHRLRVLQTSGRVPDSVEDAIKEPDQEKEMAAKASLGTYRRLTFALAKEGGTVVTWKPPAPGPEATGGASVPQDTRNADAHRQTQPTKGAPGADPLSRALGRRQDHLARVIASIEKREAVFGMLPDDSDGSPEGEEESEEGDEPDGEGEGEGEEDEEDDSEGDGEGGEGNQGKEKVDGGAGESGQAAKGKRRRRHEAYAYDGWIDDEEMEQRANARAERKKGRYSGFYVYQETRGEQGEEEEGEEEGEEGQEEGQEEIDDLGEVGEAGQGPTKSAPAQDEFGNMLTTEREARVALRTAVRRAIEGGILAEHEAAVRDNRDPKAAMGKRMATVNHALRQLAVVFEEECRTNRWSFFPGVISELGALVGAATDEEAVRETMRREARRWHSSFVRKSKELVAQLRADYEKAESAGTLPREGEVDKDGVQVAMRPSRESELLMVDLMDIYKEKAGPRPRGKKVWPAVAAECPPGAFLTEASLGAAYRRAVSKRRKSDVPQGGHTPSKGATGQAQSEGARQGASVGTEGTARAETGSLAGTGPGGGVDGEVADAETLSQDEARLAAVGGTGAKKKDAIKLLAFAFLKRRGPQGAKLSDISAYVASSLLPGSENAPDGSSEAKERKATIKSTGVYVRQDDAFVPLVVPGHYALRGHLTKEMMEKARQAEAERAAKAETKRAGKAQQQGREPVEVVPQFGEVSGTQEASMM